MAWTDSTDGGCHYLHSPTGSIACMHERDTPPPRGMLESTCWQDRILTGQLGLKTRGNGNYTILEPSGATSHPSCTPHLQLPFTGRRHCHLPNHTSPLVCTALDSLVRMCLIVHAYMASSENNSFTLHQTIILQP